MFCYGVDGLAVYLDRRLRGIKIYQTPTLGPTLPGRPPLPPVEETFRLLVYIDNVSPAITTMFEFILIDNASRLFEEASGCQLHRDPASGKVKFLPLGRWKGTLQQEDLPVRYVRLTDQLSMLGVVLTAKYVNTRRINAESVKESRED